LFPAKDEPQRFAERPGSCATEMRAIRVDEDSKLRNSRDGPAPVAIPQVEINRTFIALPLGVFPW
ncbi:MAG TPA: hypothetical protein VH087_03785, partial [Thermoanaerobaculia bacterium]|nr:hypothetical protein [Thermoanaerobaculia bacterium]